MTTNKIDRERAAIADFIEVHARLVTRADEADAFSSGKQLSPKQVIDAFNMLAGAIRSGEYAELLEGLKTSRSWGWLASKGRGPTSVE